MQLITFYLHYIDLVVKTSSVENKTKAKTLALKTKINTKATTGKTNAKTLALKTKIKTKAKTLALKT